MFMDFTVIMAVRHRFGDGRSDRDQVDVDSEAPFAGSAGEFPFACPDVNPFQFAVLQFEHRGSMQHLTFPDPQPGGGLEGITREHPVFINGHELAGGVPAAPFRNRMPLWSSRLLLIPAGVLRAENVLRIQSTNLSTSTQVNLDNFTIDNVVVFFKRGDSPIEPLGR
jgi:hypothetical protein